MKFSKFTILISALLLGLFAYGTFRAVGSTAINKTLTTNPDLENGLVGHWTFDGPDVNQATNVITDRSGQGNHGSTVGMDTATTTVFGKMGQALELDGNDDFIIAPAGLTGDPLTVSMWIKQDQTQETLLLMDRNLWSGTEGIELWIDADVVQVRGSGESKVIGTASIASGFHLITVVFDSTTGTIYVDGVEDNSGTIEQVAASSHLMNIGVYGDEISNNFDGIIDDVRIYNRSLSQEEVTRLYQLGDTTHINKTITTNPDLENGLIGHWTFDGKDLIDNVADIGPNGYYGILNDFTSGTTTVIGVIGQALDFVGTEAEILVIDQLDEIETTDTLSGSVWIRGGTRTDDDTMIHKGDGFGSGEQMLVFRDFSGAIDGGTNVAKVFIQDGDTWAGIEGINGGLDDDNWHQVGFTFTENVANGLRLYVDGVEQPASPVSTSGITDRPTGARLRFGGPNTTSGKHIDGELDDIYLWNRILTDAEMMRVYELGATTHINKTITTNPDLENGLVGHWTFDGPDLIENATDRSSSANHGSLLGFTSTTTAMGAIGQALEFDGSDDYVEISSASMEVALPLTLAGWVKSSELTTGTGGIISTDSKVDVYTGASIFYAAGEIIALYGDGGAPSSSSRRSKGVSSGFSDNKWHHVIGVIRGAADMDIYLDGVDVGGTYGGTGSAMVYTAEPAAIGRIDITSAGGWLSYHDGLLDDVRIYNRALSAAEVLKLYQLGR